jgi:hypothetical protein
MKIVVYVAAWQMACGALSFSQAANPSWKRVVLDTNEHGSRISRPSNEFASITFLDNDRIAVSEEKPTGTLTQRDSLAGPSAFVLTMQVLNASSGATMLSVTWPTRRSESSVQAVAGGLLIRTGPVLRFYNSELKQVSEIPLEENGADKWTVIVSSSRQNIVLRHYNATLNQFVLIDGTTWEVKKRWDDQSAWRPVQLPYSASDEALARADSNQQNILYSRFGSEKWYPLKRSSRAGCLTFPVWINRTSLVNADCELSLISIDGDVLMRVRPPKHWSFDGKITISPNGRYVAVKQDTGKGGGFWDTDVHWTATRVVVYDLSVKAESFCADVVPLPRDSYDFALSADGSRLAILDDRTVSVWSIQSARE